MTVFDHLALYLWSVLFFFFVTSFECCQEPTADQSSEYACDSTGDVPTAFKEGKQDMAKDRTELNMFESAESS